MNNLSRILRYIDTASIRLGQAVSYLIFPLIGVVMFEVLMRYLLRQSQLWVPETSEFLFGAIFVLGGAYAVAQGGHVRMDAIWGRFSPRGRAIIDACTAVFTFMFIGVLLWKGWLMGLDSIKEMEHTQTAWSPPIYPVKILIPISAALILLELIAKFIRDISIAVRGKQI